MKLNVTVDKIEDNGDGTVVVQVAAGAIRLTPKKGSPITRGSTIQVELGQAQLESFMGGERVTGKHVKNVTPKGTKKPAAAGVGASRDEDF